MHAVLWRLLLALVSLPQHIVSEWRVRAFAIRLNLIIAVVIRCQRPIPLIVHLDRVVRAAAILLLPRLCTQADGSTGGQRNLAETVTQCRFQHCGQPFKRQQNAANPPKASSSPTTLSECREASSSSIAS